MAIEQWGQQGWSVTRLVYDWNANFERVIENGLDATRITSYNVCYTKLLRRICAWIVTSSAVVGSSAMIRSGPHISVIAIITRWRNPPER